MALSSSQKGRIVEQLIGASLLLGSDGRLRVSLPLVDDEGVDLIVGDKDSDTPILLQIKSRFSLSKRDRYRAEVRKASFRVSDRRYILFVYYDQAKGEIGDDMWLVPAAMLASRLSGQKGARSKFIFDSSFRSKKDMWTDLHISKKDLAEKVRQLSRIERETDEHANDY